MNHPHSFSAFMETLNAQEPNPEWPSALQALWYDAKGDWEASHDIAQDIHTTMGSWIHAYLHRKEGDKWNAGYWYRQAGKPFPEYSLEEELQVLVNSIVNGQ
ncbi:hypothetical protein [Muricauda sp. MAR_2010_75]|jgi:hypothetical protein|uniref:hypothetical protein n=1 Tax=Allomuricauda sp. MAR_2010_75 TaxID=1250232 RepID=UPI00055D7EFA|nr:hypothetical protein [Muricauda sp. MAR_2010_75]